jgi:L,D-transpeptidase catalytic domain
VVYFTVMVRVRSGALMAAVLAALALAFAAGSAAATSTTITAATTPAPASTPPPAEPVKAKVRLYLRGMFFVDRHAVTVPGRLLRVAGVVRPYRPGQWVRVRARAGGALIKSVRVRLRRSRDGSYGHFSIVLKTRRVGTVSVLVGHSRNALMRAFLARRSYSVLRENVGFGSTGWFVQLIQQRLAALHFYIPQTGVFDAGTGWALDAYHRLLRWGTYQTLDGRTISWLLDGFGAFQVHDPGDGRHAEGNLSVQLLALINGRHVYEIYPISSGKPSTPTILGHFHVYSKVPGYLPDGMYFSNFFYGGYAIHGYDPAPDYPASHGCMRLPIADAIFVYDWLHYCDAVDVYY